MSSGRSSSWRSSEPAAALVLCLVVGLAAGAAPGEAQQAKGHGIEVRRVSPALVDARPGAVISCSFRVTNYTGVEQALEERVEAPDGWRSVIPPATFSLKPGEAVARFVSLAISTVAPAGRLEVKYAVRASSDYAVEDSDTVAVVVARTTRLELLVVEAPDRVVAGAHYTATLQLHSRSNAASEIGIELRGANEFPAEVEPRRLSLEAGGSATITVSMTPERDLAHAVKHSIQVIARVAGDASPEAQAVQTLLVDILPQGGPKVDPYVRVPAKLVLSGVAGTSGSGGQIELSGNGPLREEGTSEVDFLFRWPSVDVAAPMGGQAESRLNYTSDRVDVMVGDQAYGLSPLTDCGIYGLGSGVTVRPMATMEVGAFFVDGSARSLSARGVGSYVSCDLGENAEMRCNLLSRSERDPAREGWYRDTVWSIEGEGRWGEQAHVQLEYAQSRTSGIRRIGDSAYQVEIEGQFDNGAYYSLSGAWSGPDFRGQLRDYEAVDGAVVIPLSSRLRAHAACRTFRQNLERRAALRWAPEEQMGQVGIKYALSDAWAVSLDGDIVRYRDRMRPADYDRSEQALTLGVDCTTKRYAAHSAVRFGRQEDHLTSHTRLVPYFVFSGTYRPSRKQVVTVYASGGGDEVADSRLLTGTRNFGVTSSWAVSDRLKVDVNYASCPALAQGTQGEVAATYTNPDETAWKVQARHVPADSLQDGNTWVLVSYARPLQIPVGRRRLDGVLRGRVYDALDPGQAGIGQVAVEVGGSMVVTKRDGRFVVSGLPAGPATISLDNESLGHDRVATARLPITVETTPGQAAHVEIGLTKAAQLSGVVMLRPAVDRATAQQPGTPGSVVGNPRAGPEPAESRPLADVVVELGDGQETQRRATDSAGRFVFDRVRPGRWHFKVYGQTLPAYHVAAVPEADLDLAPGENRELTVDVMPRERRIQMLDGGSTGTLTPEEPSGTEAATQSPVPSPDSGASTVEPSRGEAPRVSRPRPL
jgi:hypothetical protein